MDREDFYAKTAGFDEEGLRKVLWTLYWRGSAQLRERIEARCLRILQPWRYT